MASESEKHERLIGAIDHAEEHSYGSDTDGDLAKERSRAIDYYLGKMAAAPDGRSQVVDRTVHATIQWMMPSLSRIFANGDNVVELPPVGPEDEDSAKQEGEYLNYLLLQKNNWFETFNTGAKDALITKAGYLYAYKETKRQVEPEKYERQTQEGVALIMQDKPEIVALNEYPDPDFDPSTAQPEIDPATGAVFPPVPPMLYDLEIRRTKEEVHYCVLALPPERCKVAESHNEVQLVGCPYFEYYDFCTISYLRQIGLDVPDDISDSETQDTEEDASRDQYGETTRDMDSPADPAMRRVKTRWIWIAYDYDGDGIAELNHVIRVGTTILHREEVNEIPVGVLCPDPLPHRHVGLSLADSAIPNQDITTSILRQGLDNLYLANNAQKFGDPNKVNLDDMLVSRPGGVIRTRNGAVFGADFGVLQVPNVFPNAVDALEYFKQKNEDETGVSRYFMGTDASALNKTMGGMQQLSSMSAQRVEQVARYFANGIQRLCAVLHGLVLKGGHKSDVVKLRGQWVTVDPSTWRSRKDFRICVGYSAGNKDAQLNRLMMIAGLQEKAMAGGLPIVNPRNLHKTAIEITKAADFSNPDEFWQDPRDAPPPSPPQPDPTVVFMEQTKAQTELQTTDAELRSDKELKAAELMSARELAELDSRTKLLIEQMRQQNALALKDKDAENQAGLKRLEADTEVDTEARKARAKNQPSIDVIEEVSSIVTQLREELSKVQQATSALMGAKRQIRRGKDGKAEGVDLVGPDGNVLGSQKVVRGPNGSIEGTA